jgi:superfamily II DNA or RNA helicase
MGGHSSLQFRHPFRKCQRQILDQVETSKPAERKHHIVAPPGSGKTIVGLELIRRFGKPAVVFATTATIQQ